MRVLRYQINPRTPAAKVPDYAAIEGGVMRMLVPGQTYETTLPHAASGTIARAIIDADLVAIDEESAKEAARICGAAKPPQHVALVPAAPTAPPKPSPKKAED